ncbi:MAG: nucleoside triphosphate pyrophosphohydrolase [candidate division Zixibacteria bacterium]|nr:nucleoside triphosphate pyrophosphohydrolase [candidate division Zixibacteria bacterium]
MARLRQKDGCNWDRAQTHQTLVKYLIEETYEVVECIENNSLETLKEELGDLLVQVYFHAQIADDEGRFSIDDVAHGENEKLIRRHPHVFGEKKDLNPEQVRDQWETIKIESKEKESVLAGVPKSMPALNLAFRVGEKAAGVGFDWEDPKDIFDKFKEEVGEFEAEFDAGDKERMSDELGDLLFVLVNLARKVDVDPEHALRQTVGRFIQRFGYIEDSLKSRGQKFSETSLEEMEALWQEAKK